MKKALACGGLLHWYQQRGMRTPEGWAPRCAVRRVAQRQGGGTVGESNPSLATESVEDALWGNLIGQRNQCDLCHPSIDECTRYLLRKTQAG